MDIVTSLGSHKLCRTSYDANTLLYQQPPLLVRPSRAKGMVRGKVQRVHPFLSAKLFSSLPTKPPPRPTNGNPTSNTCLAGRPRPPSHSNRYLPESQSRQKPPQPSPPPYHPSLTQKSFHLTPSSPPGLLSKSQIPFLKTNASPQKALECVPPSIEHNANSYSKMHT